MYTLQNVSLIVISSLQGKLGVITDANMAALKLFGYTAREVLNQNINILEPPPFAAVHQQILEK